MKSTRRFAGSIIALCIVCTAPYARAGTYTANWLGSNGIWEQDGGNWSTNAYPQNGHFVTINNQPFPDAGPLYNVSIANAAPCTLGSTGSIIDNVQSVNVVAGATLNIANGSWLVSTGPVVTAGLFNLNSTGSSTQLRAGDGSGIAAGGVLAMSDNSGNVISSASDGSTFTIAAGGVLRGAGNLGGGPYVNELKHYFSYVNHGLIDANQPNNGITIDLSNTAKVTNDGTIRASNTGSLRFGAIPNTDSTVVNDRGTISAIDNGTVRIARGVTVIGGTLATSGAGTIRGEFGGILKNVTNNGTIASAQDEFISANGTLTNNALVRLETGGTLGLLGGDLILGGSGVVDMTAAGRKGIAGLDYGRTLTVDTAATVRGFGQLGTNNSNFTYKAMNVVNRGVIEANGGVLVDFIASNENTNLVNSGTLRAVANATLQIIGPNTVPNSGTIDVPAGGTVQFDNGAILSNQQNGLINLDGTLNAFAGLDLNGGRLVGNGTINGDVRNNGGVISPGHSPGKLTINGNYTQASAAALNIEVGGTNAAVDYDQVKINGAASIDGILNINFINGYRPQVGDVFTFIAPNSVSGSFSSVLVNGAAGKLDYSSGAITFTVTQVPDILLNISTRINVLQGDRTLIAGFIVTGTESKKVIIRALGPTLAVSGAMADPTLELYDAANNKIAANDNWKDSQRADIEATGIPPKNDAESAIVQTLAPGAYTTILRGKNDSTGVGLAELYDLAQGAKGKASNISTRGFVDTGDNVLIGGFIVGGGGGGGDTAKVVIRAIGPSLSKAGVNGALDDPTLELKDANGSSLATNDNWKENQAAIEATKIPPSDDRESALVKALGPGAYTAIVRGKNNTTGVALVEVYNIQ